MNCYKKTELNGFATELFFTHSLVVGSGAAGLNAAVQLHREGIEDILVITEGLNSGTSINTGSDKQTYYKLGIYGRDNDSPEKMARALCSGGGMHGDIALTEAANSPRAFMNLVELGVKFPRDSFGQFVGYRTDHDPLRRASSTGPYTSRDICLALIAEIRKRKIPVFEQRHALTLLIIETGRKKRAAGAIALNRKNASFDIYIAENVVFAVGGPGGIYKTSVYPEVHTGAIGLALMEGAKARNLQESQFGLASTKFRWNVSGSYMQAIPRFISTAKDGKSDEHEFLLSHFKDAAKMNSMIFLKGYQWPFDARKADAGSSMIDILVYLETAMKKRRVFLDYARNGSGFNPDDLSEEAQSYLEKSGALLDTPFERLQRMNPEAVELYRSKQIDISGETLEIAVCAQHNNGGLAGNIWWESENIRHLFPVGEVNGSHGVFRPGGSALNSGQVAGIRTAEYIARRYGNNTLDLESAEKNATEKLASIIRWLDSGRSSDISQKEARDKFQERMSANGGIIRSEKNLEHALESAKKQWNEIKTKGIKNSNTDEALKALECRHLCFTHVIYLEAILSSVRSGVGSRGSCLIPESSACPLHSSPGSAWNFVPENRSYRNKVLETFASYTGESVSRWTQKRKIPKSDAWFECAWKEFQNGEIYNA